MKDKAYVVVEYNPRLKYVLEGYEKMVKKYTGRSINHCWQQKDWFAKHFYEEHGISIWSVYDIKETDMHEDDSPVLDWNKFNRIEQNKAAKMRNRKNKRRNRK